MQGYLTDADIDSALFVDDAGGAEAGLAFSNSARLVVRREDAERALTLLSSAES